MVFLASALVRGSGRMASVKGPLCTTIATRALTDDGYLHKTPVPTFAFQEGLRKVPVPKLEDTVERFLASAQPLCTAEELADARATIEEFANGAGKTLQASLTNRDAHNYSCYVNDFWNAKYLLDRSALPINVNPVLIFKDDGDVAKQDMVTRAASLIHASTAFYRTLRDGHLYPDLYPGMNKHPLYAPLINALPAKLALFASYAFKTYPLDMVQFKSLFHVSRIPKTGCDFLLRSSEADGSRHIIVQYGHGFYKLDVLDDTGAAISEGKIAKALQGIVAGGPDLSSPPLGAGTTLDRDSWASLRDGIVADPTNKASVNAIDTAMFALCLEHTDHGPAPGTSIENVLPSETTALTESFLYGEGRNRWFDKSFQLIVDAKGRAGVNFEHAWGDGKAVLRYFEEIYSESIATPAASPEDGLSAERLEFSFSKDSAAALVSAADAFDAARGRINLKTLLCKDITKKDLDELKLRGDPFLQLSFQLAHYRLFGKNASTYESVSMAGFKHGRTETMRSCTVDSDTFVRAFTDKNASIADKDKAMRAAISYHAKTSLEITMGKNGWDRHLFALRSIAKEEGSNEHALYSHPVFKRLENIILSTSTLVSPALFGGGFGPFSEECIAIGYSLIDVGIGVSIATLEGDSQKFLDAVEQSLHDMIEVAREAEALPKEQ